MMQWGKDNFCFHDHILSVSNFQKLWDQGDLLTLSTYKPILTCELNKLFENPYLYQVLGAKYVKIKCLETSTCSNMSKLDKLQINYKNQAWTQDNAKLS